MTVGFLAYGVGLRHLRTARTGAYFPVAPFFGAVEALAAGEPLTLQLAVAALLMTAGVWLHLTEQHRHEHAHDAHHQHRHDAPVAPGTQYVHCHRHEPLEHAHAHFPDAHHRDRGH